MRKLIGVIVGLVLAVALIDGLWALAGAWFSAPVVADASGQDVLAQTVMRMPLAGQATIAATWLLAGLVGTFAALRIAQWRPAGWIVAMLVVAADLWNVIELAQPPWLAAATLVLPLVGAWLAERHYHRARPGDPLIN